MNKEVICQYCNNVAALVGGDIIYPNSQDLKKLRFWLCKSCNAYVGTHKTSDNKPLGSLAKPLLRIIRHNAHNAFDRLWTSNSMSRTEAYTWLAKELNIDLKYCHIGMFDEEQCRKTIEISINEQINRGLL
jgi:hypothetical protein